MAHDLTHIDGQGNATMVDVSSKVHTPRSAVAKGYVRMSAAAFEAAISGNNKKGPVLLTAQIAGISGGKKTSDLIPLCHALPLSSLKIDIVPDDDKLGFVLTAKAKTNGQTGVEMEALTAVSVACLTLYDMLKAIDKAMIIGPIGLVEKTGGNAGDFVGTFGRE